MVASVQPKVSEYLALLGGLNLNLRNWVQYYQLEDWRRRWRLTLRSLQNYLHHLNHWKYGADRFREVRGDINAAIVKLDRVSSR